MWGAGVIMYALLMGRQPFLEANDSVQELCEKIINQDIDFSNPMQQFSMQAKDLILNLLCKSHKKRITPSQALQHEWISIMKLKCLYEIDQLTERRGSFSEDSSNSLFAIDSQLVMAKSESICYL